MTSAVANKERPADKENSKYMAAPLAGTTDSIYKSSVQTSLTVRNTSSTLVTREYPSTWDHER